MERYTLEAQKRTDAGKGVARSLRRAGNVPAVIYRSNKSTPLTMNGKELAKFIRNTGGDQVLVDLNLDGKKKVALLKEFQVDPVDGELLHADFFEVSLKEKVRVGAHIAMVGEPIGVKKDKGILQQILREIEIECLPGNIPGTIELDISDLETGHSKHVRDLAIPADVTLLTDPSEVICTVTAPKVEVEAVEEEVVEGEEVPAEAEAAKAEEEKKEEEKKEEA